MLEPIGYIRRRCNTDGCKQTCIESRRLNYMTTAFHSKKNEGENQERLFEQKTWTVIGSAGFRFDRKRERSCVVYVNIVL